MRSTNQPTKENLNMLELPELETARRDLDREVGGLKIKEIEK